MEEKSALTLFPRKHIKPYDGMSVTADVWAHSHGEHRQARQAHDLFFHGTGIVTGLEVVANDPPDRYVFISPGVAVDQAGNTIVITEPIAYDFGASVDGMLYLLLGHGEREAGGVDREEKYNQAEFLVAARPALPKRPAVELARIILNGPGGPIQNASQPAHPKRGEIDLRFRVGIMPVAKKVARVGVISLGADTPQVVRGWELLARACQQLSAYTLAVDLDLAPDSDLSQYDLVYLCANGKFSLEAKHQAALARYLETGKMILIDAIDPAADTSFNSVFEKMEFKFMPLAAEDALLVEPFLFSSAPPGYQEAQVSRYRNIIYSCCGYGLAWAGQLAPGHAARADIRAAHEWGVNIIHYCLNHSGG